MQVDHYVLQKKLGEGALGKVFRAIDTRTSELVALKLLHPHLISDPKFVGVLHHEMLIASKLDHPKLLKLLDYRSQEPHIYFVTQYVDGWSLKDFLKKVGRVPPLIALCICHEIARALDYLHLRDMIHADLSSGNILIARDGSLVVSDYGLVSDLSISNFKNQLVGTPGYYSPEHVTNQSLTPKSDLYVLGLHLMEMINGYKAIMLGRSRDHASAIYQEMLDFKPFFKCSEPYLTKTLEQLASGLLHAQAQNRWESSDDVANIIKKILAVFGIDNPSLAMRQFIYDCRLSSMCLEREQDIYFGNSVYTSEDLNILRQNYSYR